ncbi:MAG: hypothetical protein ACYTBJ_24965 [Planctomycetota bacterium]
MEKLEMKYFVLKPASKYKGDPFARASRNAMRAYSATMRNEGRIEFANQIAAWLEKEQLADQSLAPKKSSQPPSPVPPRKGPPDQGQAEHDEPPS